MKNDIRSDEQLDSRARDTDGLEELQVPVSVTKDPKLNELTDLSHLLAAALLKTRRQ